MKYPVLETDRLFLRCPTAEDQRGLVAQLSKPMICATAPVKSRPSWCQMAAMSASWEVSGAGLFALIRKGSDKPIGLVGPWTPPNWPEPELGWAVWDDDPFLSHTAEGIAAVRGFAATRLRWSDLASFVDCDKGAALLVQMGCLDDPFALTRDGAQVFRHPPLRDGMVFAA